MRSVNLHVLSRIWNSAWLRRAGLRSCTRYFDPEPTLVIVLSCHYVLPALAFLKLFVKWMPLCVPSSQSGNELDSARIKDLEGNVSDILQCPHVVVPSPVFPLRYCRPIGIPP